MQLDGTTDYRQAELRMEQKIFASWTDTDTSNSVDNLFPNLIVYGKDINTGLRTVCKNFTENTAFDSGIMFDYIGNIVLSNSGTYTIPVTYATFNMAYDPTDTTYHHYLAVVFLRIMIL